jgi:hypothetical protein
MGWSNLPWYVLLPTFMATAFMLWVLWKFWEEEHRHGARSRNSEKSGEIIRILESSSSPLHEGNLDVGRTAGSFRPPEHPKAA